ncbi:hypothetical protein Y419_14555 [Listeria monocytogenes]|nr:hypothetical protein [Listeria monocytogenes]
MSYFVFLPIATVILIGFLIIFAVNKKRKMTLEFHVSLMTIYGGIVYLFICSTSLIMHIIYWFTH